MQYAVHLTVRRRVQAFRVRKSRFGRIKLAAERERLHSLVPIRPPLTAQD